MTTKEVDNVRNSILAIKATQKQSYKDEDVAKAFQLGLAFGLGEWIPCSERLPEIHNFCQLYLVTYKQGQICTAFYTETNGRSWWSIDGVEAWMPLPKPYKEGKE